MGINNSDLRRWMNYDGHKHTDVSDAEYDEDRCVRREAAILVLLECAALDAHINRERRGGASDERVKALAEVVSVFRAKAREWSR